jgi:hypothetical protein
LCIQLNRSSLWKPCFLHIVCLASIRSYVIHVESAFLFYFIAEKKKTNYDASSIYYWKILVYFDWCNNVMM